MILQDYNQTAPNDYYGLVNSTNYVCQTFTTTSEYDISAITIEAGKIRYLRGTASDIVYCKLYAVDGNHKPTGSALATASKSLSAFGDSTAAGLFVRTIPYSDSCPKQYTFNFSSDYRVSTSTEYALVFYIDSTTGGIYLSGHDSSGYTSGRLFFSTNSGSTWTEKASIDLFFETYSKYDLINYYESGTEATVSLGGQYWGAQTFTPDTNLILKSIELKVKRASSDIGAAIVSLRAAAENEPSGEDIAVGTVYSADIPLATDWVEFVLDIPVNLTSGTQYSFVVRTSTTTSPGLYVTEDSDGGYAGGTELYSENSGSTWSDTSDDYWFRLRGVEVGEGEPGISPISDVTTTKKLCAIGASEFWYVDSDNNWVVLSSSIGDIDSTSPLTAVEAYGKIFIANGSNKKVADFANVKITTLNIGSHPPDFGTVLTGSTSGAVMVVDYISSLAGAMSIYGRRINKYPFQAETVTGTDDDGNSISFTGTAETLGPHWYDWTTFGGSSNFGTLPDSFDLVSLFNGRIVVAGIKAYPHEWQMSQVYNPWNYLYESGVAGTALASGSTEAGQIGDVITSLIPYADDFFIFGCASSMYLLDGDPTYGGTIESLSNTEGTYGARSWCKDSQENLYFFSGDGLYKAEGGRSKPVSLSETRIPKWADDWPSDSNYYRVTLSFDPIDNGIIISNTSLADGSNQNYWYDITIDGFYPEFYPASCSIFSCYFYNAIDSSYRELLLGCNDGYIRTFDLAQLDDEGTSSDSAIQSWCSLPIKQLNDDSDRKGKIQRLKFITGKNTTTAASFTNGIPDTDDDGYVVETETSAGSIYYEVYVGDEAETVLCSMISSKNIFTSGTLESTGRSNTIRPRARGYVCGIRLYNFNDTETWSMNKITGTIIPV